MLVKSNGVPVIPTVFDNLFRDWSSTNFSETNTSLPAVNIKEDEDGFTVNLAAPGMDKKDFNIDLNNDVLTISSEKNEENKEEKDNYTRREYSYQSFKRSFNLPKNIVDNDKIKATYTNGELSIVIPKREEAKPKPARLIEVK
ncbi:Hsp20/alpha crystallin family protein [Aureibaculum sp. A20]|uniref:Hsp20/alpha crystallin family protein n=1 Tax=Aureibaculum flavum TaxID=2795986 RepID=A0ABS0WUD3_9FLAO|nr:Hsp20/alpha crystallin family protein [Aureibaculum flavum]MBJ2175586.1 Hsp20/alpha crystallin family protein [Aureibaculum flavum]